MHQLSFKCHRFPPDIIRHSIWLYGRVTYSALSTTGSLRGSRTVVIPACAASRPRLTPKKKRKAETAAWHCHVNESGFQIAIFSCTKKQLET
jgi:hypothetical protein